MVNNREEIYDYMLMRHRVPGTQPQTVGVLLHDTATDTLHIRMRDSWDDLEKDDLDYLETLTEDLRYKASEMGPSALLRHLEDSLSNVWTLSSREQIRGDDPTTAAENLHLKHAAHEG